MHKKCWVLLELWLCNGSDLFHFKAEVSENGNLEDLFKQFASLMPLKGYKLLQVSDFVWRSGQLRTTFSWAVQNDTVISLSLNVVFTHPILFLIVFFVFLQAAFRIRGLSRKQLERLKSKNITLLENGLLDVPQQTWAPVQTLTVFAVKGSNLLSLQEVNIAVN